MATRMKADRKVTTMAEDDPFMMMLQEAKKSEAKKAPPPRPQMRPNEKQSKLSVIPDDQTRPDSARSRSKTPNAND